MKITVNGIVIEGTRDELRDTLEMLLERTASQPLEQGEDGGVSSTSGQELKSITVEQFRSLWPQLTAQAQAVLGLVAQQPNGFPVADLLAHLDVDGRSLGGILSSLGFAVKRVPGVQDPLVRDWTLNQYRLAPEIAAAIRELEEEKSA